MASLWVTCHACGTPFEVTLSLGATRYRLKRVAATCTRCGRSVPLPDGEYEETLGELSPTRLESPAPRLRRPSQHGHPRIAISRNDPCPCGSGRKAKKCLLAVDRDIHPPHASTLPPRPSTGNENGRCYLSHLADCSAKISREHAQSRAILDRIAGKSVVASGHAPQEPGDVRTFGIESLVSKVLCTRHNSSLAALDARGAALARGIIDVLALLAASPAPDPTHLILNGHDIERWCLKSLIGMIASKNIRLKEARVRDYRIPRSWTGVLMGERVLSPPSGLYTRADPSDDVGFLTKPIPDYGVRPLWDHTARTIVGVEVRLLGLELVLWLDERRRRTRPDLGTLNFRCPMLYSRRGRSSAIVEFSWEAADSGTPIEVTRHSISADGTCIPGHDFNERWSHWGESLDETIERYQRLRKEAAAEGGLEKG